MKSPRPKSDLNGEDVPMVEIKTVKLEVIEEAAKQTNGLVIPPVQIVINEATSIIPQASISQNESSGQSVKSLKKSHCSVKKARKKQVEHQTKKKRCCFSFPLLEAHSSRQTASLQVPTTEGNVPGMLLCLARSRVG